MVAVGNSMPIKITLLCVFIFFLSACGYHLRGSDEAPVSLKNIYLEGGSAEFRDQFKQVFKSSRRKLAKSPQNASVVIKIVKDKMNRRVLSLSERGRSNEFEINYRVEYEVNKSGKILLAGRPLEISREYFNDQADIIAKDNEERVIRSEMYQQAVRSVVNRARVVLEANSQ